MRNLVTIINSICLFICWGAALVSGDSGIVPPEVAPPVQLFEDGRLIVAAQLQTLDPETVECAKFMGNQLPSEAGSGDDSVGVDEDGTACLKTQGQLPIRIEVNTSGEVTQGYCEDLFKRSIPEGPVKNITLRQCIANCTSFRGCNFITFEANQNSTSGSCKSFHLGGDCDEDLTASCVAETGEFEYGISLTDCPFAARPEVDVFTQAVNRFIGKVETKVATILGVVASVVTILMAVISAPCSCMARVLKV